MYRRGVLPLGVFRKRPNRPIAASYNGRFSENS
eukprot:IDg1402t1